MTFEYPSTKTARKEKKQKKEDAKIEKAGKIFDKKFKKYAGSKEAHLHAKDFDEGVNIAEDRAISETMQEYKKMAKGGRTKLKGGGISIRGLGRAFMKGGKV